MSGLPPLGTALALVGLFATLAPGAESLRPHLLSLKERELGRLTGRLFVEPARPDEAVKPLGGVTVLALPGAPPLWTGLDRLRQEYRSSAANYTTVLARFERLIQDYRREVEREGGEQLVRTAVADPDGRFELDLPGGSWVLVVSHSTVSPTKQPPPKPKPPPAARLNVPPLLPAPPPPTKVKEVSLWAYRVEVPAGRDVLVELHDRNRWLTHLVKE